MEGSQKFPQTGGIRNAANDPQTALTRWARGDIIKADRLNQAVDAINRQVVGVRPSKQELSETGREIKYLVFQQGNADFVDDGENFPRTVLQGRQFMMTRLWCYFSTGEFDVDLYYNGSAIASNITEATSFPLELSPHVFYRSNRFIWVACNTSTDVAEWEMHIELVPLT